jgi:YidC/Oxa1 family membrane protein insertase
LTLYVGPQEADRLKAYGIGLEKTMDLGWALFRPLTEATLWIMDQMRRFIPNYGVIIILFSVLTKLAFYPLTRTSTRSMKKMQMLQPKIKALQEKYKDNQEKQSKAMMELYKKENVNPMSGCLPLLLQMPVFVALYQALAHTIALRNTPFVWWIDDLSKPDALFSFGGFALPLVGWTDFNLLPLLMTATMVIQTRMTPTGQAQGQMAMMNTLMPVMMFFFFYQMPSGLVLYWLVNNLMTIYQTWRIHQTATPEASTETT